MEGEDQGCLLSQSRGLSIDPREKHGQKNPRFPTMIQKAERWKGRNAQLERYSGELLNEIVPPHMTQKLAKQKILEPKSV